MSRSSPLQSPRCAELMLCSKSPGVYSWQLNMRFHAAFSNRGVYGYGLGGKVS